MTRMLGKTKNGNQIQVQVDEQGRVVVVIQKSDNLIQRLIKRVRGKRG